MPIITKLYQGAGGGAPGAGGFPGGPGGMPGGGYNTRADGSKGPTIEEVD